MKKENPELLDALLGAAILASAAEKAESDHEQDKHVKRAEMLREQYEAFIEVGFTEEQATQFVCAILN